MRIYCCNGVIVWSVYIGSNRKSNRSADNLPPPKFSSALDLRIVPLLLFCWHDVMVVASKSEVVVVVVVHAHCISVALLILYSLYSHRRAVKRKIRTGPGPHWPDKHASDDMVVCAAVLMLSSPQRLGRWSSCHDRLLQRWQLCGERIGSFLHWTMYSILKHRNQSWRVCTVLLFKEQWFCICAVLCGLEMHNPCRQSNRDLVQLSRRWFLSTNLRLPKQLPLCSIILWNHWQQPQSCHGVRIRVQYCARQNHLPLLL